MTTQRNPGGPAKVVPGEATADVMRAVYNKTLEGQNKLADVLISKLEKIKVLWAELPTADDLDDLDKVIGSIAANLKEASETYNADDFPHPDMLHDLDKKLSGIAGNLDQIIEITGAEDFPGEDDFDALDKKLSGITSSLDQIIENQEAVVV